MPCRSNCAVKLSHPRAAAGLARPHSFVPAGMPVGAAPVPAAVPAVMPVQADLRPACSRLLEAAPVPLRVRAIGAVAVARNIVAPPEVASDPEVRKLSALGLAILTAWVRSWSAADQAALCALLTTVPAGQAATGSAATGSSTSAPGANKPGYYTGTAKQATVTGSTAPAPAPAPVPAPATTPAPTPGQTPGPQNNNTSEGFSTWQIAGIAVGGVIVAGSLTYAAYKIATRMPPPAPESALPPSYPAVAMPARAR
jgi:hypothetical protein